jgi:hypothetical protein
MRAGSAEKTVPDVWYLKFSIAGFSKLAIAISAPVRSSRIAPTFPVRSTRGSSQPNDEQQ